MVYLAKKEAPKPESKKTKEIKAKTTEVKKVSTTFKVEKLETPVLPEFKNRSEIDVRYPLIKPYVNVHVYWDEKRKQVTYEIEEPELNDKEKRLLKIIESGLEELISLSFLAIKTEDAVVEYLEKSVKILLNELNISVNEKTFLKLMYYIYRNFVGLNEIEALMRDYYIEDVECNGLDSPIYIVHRKFRHLRTNVVFKNLKYLTTFVEKLAQKCGKYISYASPTLDGALPDGSRVNATYSQEITTKGPTFTIRKFTTEPWSPVKLIEFKTASPELFAYLWLCIEHETNIMVIGGTGTGKTSFLNALAFFIPPSMRIVSIEDTKELNLLHENWLPSVSRKGLGIGTEAGYGEVSLFDLLKASFRQRPDYIIVGEIRGKEAFVLFQGMSAGHPSFGTMHAEDVETMIRRLESPPINLSPSLVESMDAVVVMTHAKIGKKAVRRVRDITEIIKVSEELGKVDTNKPFMWDPRADKFYFKLDSVVFKKIMERGGLTQQELLSEFKIRTRLLMELYKRKIIGFKEVQDVIHTYYKDPQEVLKRFGIIS